MKTKFAELFAIIPILSSWTLGDCAGREAARARIPNADTHSARCMPALLIFIRDHGRGLG
jgi:hypothetical protein